VFGRQARPEAKESLARRRRQCLRASGGRSLPRGLEIKRCFERVEKSRNGWKKGKCSILPAVKILSSIQRERTQARGVSVCRLRRNMAGRAGLFGEAERQRPALLGTAAIAPGEGSAI